MSTSMAWWLVCWFALAVGLHVAHRAASWSWPYRVAPGLMASVAAMCVADNTATVFGVALSVAQNPSKPYLPAMLVLAAAATALTVLAHRRHEIEVHQ